MKKAVYLLGVLILLSGMLGCSNDSGSEAPDSMPDPDDPPANLEITFLASLDGASVNPPTGSSASGTATLTFDTSEKTFTITVIHSGLDPNNGHIHRGAVGESGGVVFPFSNFESPIEDSGGPLDTAQESDLNANLYYVNLHSTSFPDGEIRGQLIKQ